MRFLLFQTGYKPSCSLFSFNLLRKKIWKYELKSHTIPRPLTLLKEKFVHLGIVNFQHINKGLSIKDVRFSFVF